MAIYLPGTQERVAETAGFPVVRGRSLLCDATTFCLARKETGTLRSGVEVRGSYKGKVFSLG
jgi:hypothetical protein